MNLGTKSLSPSVYSINSGVIAAGAVWYPVAGLQIRAAKASNAISIKIWLNGAYAKDISGTDIIVNAAPMLFPVTLPMTDGTTIGFKNYDVVDRNVTIYGERWA